MGGVYNEHDSATRKGIAGIAELRKKVVSGNEIWLKYHTTEGDGGGGLFRGVTGAVINTYSDNNGTIIVPDGGDGSSAWLRECSSVLNVRWFGAIGDGSTDDTLALQNAYSASSKLYFPDGTYIVSPLTSLTPTGHAKVVNYMFMMRSDTLLNGTGIIKLADNFSTDVSPMQFVLLFSQMSDVSNIGINGLSFDFNMANNPISPNRATGTYNPFIHAVLWSWRAGCNDFRFTNNRVYNENGYNCIILNHPLNAADLVTARGALIEGNTFTNTGYDTNDHTCVISYQDETLILNNTFKNNTIAPAPTNAFELHGADSIARGNLISGYHRGFFVGGSMMRATNNIKVIGNIINVRTQGGIIYTDVGFPNYSGVEIAENTFNIDGVQYGLSSGVSHSCIAIYGQGSAVSDIDIHHNVLSFPAPAPGTRRFLCIASSITSVAAAPDNITIKDNILKNATIGINFDLNATTGTMHKLSIKGNKFINMTSQRTGVGQGIYLNPSIGNESDHIDVVNNEFIYTGVTANEFKYGVGIRNAIKYINVDGNSESGLINSLFHNYTNNQIIMRGGEFVFSVPPTWGQWLIGDFVRNFNPTEQGAAGSKYVVEGWVCVTSGAPGVWLQRRTMTGN